MKKRIMLTLACLISFCSLMAQFKTSEQIVPMDTAIRYGVLDNGLTYFILKSKEEPGIAEFRLIQKTGSLVEEDNEKGMAHFLEHMLFQGTKHFPGNDIIKYLERNGVAHGKELNAVTKFETTQYFFEGAPTARESFIDSCFLILRDWSTDAIIDKNALDLERSVIVEEWRYRNSPIWDKVNEEMLKGSRYAERNPIGDMNVINSCTAEQMMAFYKKWYQPQNQYVIAIGDFDSEVIETKIKNTFGHIKSGNTLIPSFALPADHETPSVFIVRDPKATGINFSLEIRHNNTIGSNRSSVNNFKLKKIHKIVESVFGDMVHKNISENSNLIESLDLNNDSYSKNCKTLSYSLYDIPTNDYKEVIKNQLVELEKIKRFGISEKKLASELLRFADDDTITSNEDTVNLDFSLVDTLYNKENTLIKKSDIYDCILNDEPVISYNTQHILDEYFKSHITKEMVNEEICRLFKKENRTIIITIPEKADIETPSEEDILSLFSEVEAMELSADTIADDEDEQTEPVNVNPKPGKIIKKRKLKDIDYTEYTLSNGVMVVMNNEPDSTILDTKFLAILNGGKSILDNDELIYSTFIEPETKYDPRGIDIDFGDTKTQYSFEIDYFAESIKNKDYCLLDIDDKRFKRSTIEKKLKQFYCTLTNMEIDTVKYQNKLKSLYRNALATKTERSNALSKLKSFDFASSERDQEPCIDMIEAINMEQLHDIVKRLKSNYNGMVMVIQTNDNPKMLLPYIKKYVASLPSKSQLSSIIDRKENHIKAYNDKFTAYIDNPIPSAEVYLSLNQEEAFEFNAKNVIFSDALVTILNKLLYEEIREKYRNVYAIGSSNDIKQVPVSYHKYNIMFQCSPNEVDGIISNVYIILNQMAEGSLVTQELIDFYKSNKKKETTYSFLVPSDLDKIAYRFCKNNNNIYSNDKSELESVTVASLKQFVKDLLEKGHINEFIIRTK